MFARKIRGQEIVIAIRDRTGESDDERASEPASFLEDERASAFCRANRSPKRNADVADDKTLSLSLRLQKQPFAGIVPRYRCCE